MPYLDQPWRPPEEFPAGEWLPEIDQRGWQDRHRGLRYASWVRRDGLTREDASQLQNINGDEKNKYFEALGADIGSAQRDGFLYANFLECLKRSAPVSDNDSNADQAADDVVERMKTMGLASAYLDERQGGPPSPQSLRPWRAVMNWLLSLLRNVRRFLVNAVEAFRALVRGLTKDVASQIFISFSASIPPAITFGINLQQAEDKDLWNRFTGFATAMQEQMENLLGPKAEPVA